MTARADRHITADLHDLSFRSVVPGGFASARMTVNRSLAWQPDEIAYYGRVIIYDARNGRTVWEGRLEDPGRSAGASGELWELAAVGPSAHASDLHRPRIWADRRLQGAWVVYEQKSKANAKVELAQDAAGNPVIRLAPTSATVAANWRASMIYRAIRDCGQVIARVRIGHTEGWTNATWEVEIFSHDSGDAETVVDTDTVSTTPGELVGVYNTDIPAGDDAVEYLLNVPGGSAGIDQTTWTIGLVHCVRAALHSKAGALITTGYTADIVLASEVVADLLGTLLDQYDGANATVTATTFGFDQLAYPDGVTPAEVFRDLMALEPTFYWAAWEQNPATGKHRFEWVTWPTTVAYEVGVEDGYSSTGSAEGLYNEVDVRWRNQLGLPKVTMGSQTVQVLNDAGLIRSAFLDLSDEIGSSANATRAAAQFLTDHAAPPNQGSLTISRPIYDHDRGMMISPWEIRP
ncbi:MAG: hypothetical protein ACRD0W_01120, partial [Acidimicrobiales bacterium]